MIMKQITKFLMMLSLIAIPVTFTSCGSDDDYYYGHNNLLVRDAVQNYWNTYPSGTDYNTTKTWFWYYYPRATDSEFAAFMEAVNYGHVDNNKPVYNEQLVAQAKMLIGEWAGKMTLAYDENGKRQSQTFHARMKFFQYEDSKNSFSGHGVEVDTDSNGATQTLDFTWYIDKNGDIYIKYTKSGTIFRMDAKSSTKGFHLGYENQKGYDTFFGYGVGTNTTDEFYIDLARQSTNNAKGKLVKSRTASGDIAGKVFGNATQNIEPAYSQTSVSGLRAR